jgi:hypothetical protein
MSQGINRPDNRVESPKNTNTLDEDKAKESALSSKKNSIAWTIVISGSLSLCATIAAIVTAVLCIPVVPIALAIAAAGLFLTALVLMGVMSKIVYTEDLKKKELEEQKRQQDPHRGEELFLRVKELRRNRRNVGLFS